MFTEREILIDAFCRLGERFAAFGGDGASYKTLSEAVAENRWFTPEDILRAVSAIRTQMLDRELLEGWLAPYKFAHNPKNVGVIMAGNIPLAGFFDLLCVIMSGHSCLIKPSSKDSVLVSYAVSELKEIYPAIPVRFSEVEPGKAEAVIATGSDNSNRYFRSKYGNIPSLLRGSRSSAAILTGNETENELAGLADDIFSYSGLGCRSVSHILIPADYEMKYLAGRLSQWKPVNPKYINNFMQRSALLDMQGERHLKGKFFLLRESEEFPSCISEITFHRYGGIRDADRWLLENASALQCVVGSCASGTSFPRCAGFGKSQMPSLTDYPDGMDTMAFLAAL